MEAGTLRHPHTHGTLTLTAGSWRPHEDRAAPGPADPSFIVSGTLRPGRGLAGPCPGPTNSPLQGGGEQGGNPQRSSPFLCALFFVLLKSSPPWRWSPPPPQPPKGAEARGVIRNPDCKVASREALLQRAAHCFPGLNGEGSLRSRWPPGGRMRGSLPEHPKPSREEQGLHRSGTLSPFKGADTRAKKNGPRGRQRRPWEPVRLQGATTRKEKALCSPPFSRGERENFQSPGCRPSSGNTRNLV